MPTRPLYTGRNVHPSYQLYYDWSGWPSGAAFPPAPPDGVWEALAAAWEPDGLRLLARTWSSDCVHLTFSFSLRGDVAQSPEEIALAFQNNLAYVMGQRRVWQETYYVGTFGEYDLNVVRQSAAGR